MEEWLARRAALYQLIKLVDENNGCIIINTDKVMRVFNDANNIVKVEYMDGHIGLLADADFETLNKAINKWQSDLN